jgi:hypothetical protein
MAACSEMGIEAPRMADTPAGRLAPAVGGIDRPS